MRGCAAPGQADGGETLTIECGQLRRQQIVGDQHGIVGQRKIHRPRLAGERQQHVRLDVEQVIGPLAQARILQCLEGGDGAADRSTPRISGALARNDQLLRRLIQLRVVEKLQMRRNDCTAGGASGSRHAREAGARVRPGLIERDALMRSAAALFSDGDFAAFDSRSAADGKTGDRRHAGENSSRLRGAGFARRCVRRTRGGSRAAVTRSRLHVQCLLNAAHDAGHGLRSIGTAGPNCQLVALAHPERHDGDHAARIGAAAMGGERRLRAKCLGALCQQRRGPRMQALAQRHDERLRGGRVIRPRGRLRRRWRWRWRCARCGFGNAGDLEQQISRRHRPGRAALAKTQAIHGRHQDGRHQALGTARDGVQVEANQFIPRPDARARPHARLEAAAGQRNRVDADMNQHVDAGGCANRDRVSGCRQGGDFAGAGGEENPAGRVNGEAVAQHALGKHRIRHRIQRVAPTIERRQNPYVRH